MSLPRLVLAAPSTGQGKTTVATGLLEILASQAELVRLVASFAPPLGG